MSKDPERTSREDPQAMERDPQPREEVRKQVLTQELMRLPAVIGTPQPDEPPLFDQVRRMDSRLGNVSGAQYEQRVAHRAISRVAPLGIARARVALSAAESRPSFRDAMAVAVETGLIHQEELEDLSAADVVLEGADGAHAVIEASLGPDGDDLERAARRAAILERATGRRAISAVAAPETPEALRKRAKARGIHVLDIQP